MARRKLEKITDVSKSETRLAGMKSISTTLDLGNGLTITAYETLINDTKKAVGQYNLLLSSVDDAYNTALKKMEELRDLSERMLTGVAARYGKNSSQYEMAGGTRKSEKKKPVKKQPVAV